MEFRQFDETLFETAHLHYHKELDHIYIILQLVRNHLVINNLNLIQNNKKNMVNLADNYFFKKVIMFQEMVNLI